MSRHGVNDKIKRLEKRAKWLESRMVDLPDNSFDRGEASALRWAIPILQEYVRVRSHPDLPTTPGDVSAPMPSPDLGEGKEK